LVGRCNQVIESSTIWDPPLWDPSDLAWHAGLERTWRELHDEWSSLPTMRLPWAEDVLTTAAMPPHSVRVGVLVANGRQVSRLADRFSTAAPALQSLRGLQLAMWTVLEPGAEIAERRRVTSGVIEYHLPIACNGDASIRVQRSVRRYQPGQAVAFDPTARHAAWNRGPGEVVLLVLEVRRSLNGVAGCLNRVLQRSVGHHALDEAARRSAEWDTALNPGAHGG
jgi:beta-hydroxylase